MLALFSLPLPAMAMSSDAAGMNFALNSNGEITRGAIIPDQRANAAVPDSITLNFTECELHVGESIELIATVWPDSLSARVNLVWNSRNQSVAQVNSHGLVTAVGVGSSVVSVVCGTVRATCEITVKENEILAQAVELTPESAELEVGGKIALVANISPENTTDKSLVWTSSDMTVASVDETGEVTAVAEGACVITATCGEVAGTCAITVKTPVIPADSIVLDPNSAEIEVGKTLEITATVYPENTTDSRLTWRSSDNHVATVREHGHWSATVTAINPGECIITAECYNPDGVILGSSSITVKIHEVIADSILLNLDSAMIAIGEELSLFATVYPDDVTEPLTWQSSNEDIATVDQDGVVKAVAAGECDVTASCGISSSCHIQVYDPADVVISFDCNEARVVLNHEFVLTPSVSIPVRGGLAVTSSDSTVVKAKVDDDKVTLSGVGFGKATISVSSLDGLAQSDSCEVVVSTVLGDVNSDGNLTIGLKNEGTIVGGDWLAAGNFRLTYLGEQATAEAIAAAAECNAIPAANLISAEAGNPSTVADFKTSPNFGAVQKEALQNVANSNTVEQLVADGNLFAEITATKAAYYSLCYYADAVENKWYVLGYDNSADSEVIAISKKLGDINDLTKGGAYENAAAAKAAQDELLATYPDYLAIDENASTFISNASQGQVDGDPFNYEIAPESDKRVAVYFSVMYDDLEDNETLLEFEYKSDKDINNIEIQNLSGDMLKKYSIEKLEATSEFKKVSLNVKDLGFKKASDVLLFRFIPNEGALVNLRHLIFAVNPAKEGDLTGDDEVNAADIQKLLNIIAEGGDADLTGDGETNAADIQKLLNIIAAQ